MLPHPAPPLAWPDPHPSSSTAMPVPGFPAAEWRRGRVLQPHGQWRPLQGTRGVPVVGTAGAVGGQGSGGQLCEGPREPATP